MASSQPKPQKSHEDDESSSSSSTVSFQPEPRERPGEDESFMSNRTISITSRRTSHNTEAASVATDGSGGEAQNTSFPSPPSRNSDHPAELFRPRFYCSECPDFFFKKDNCKRHLRECHQTPKREFPCDLCSGSYRSKSARTLHVKRAHCQNVSIVRPSPIAVEEEDVSEAFPSPIAVEKVNKQAKILCDYPGCTESYTELWKLLEHIETHQRREGPIPVLIEEDEVSEAFPSPIAVEKVNDQAKILCDYPGCTESYTELWKLLEHIETHHTREGPGRKIEEGDDPNSNVKARRTEEEQ